eukprot:5986530-Pyramimonas_sp.AAC.1
MSMGDIILSIMRIVYPFQVYAFMTGGPDTLAGLPALSSAYASGLWAVGAAERYAISPSRGHSRRGGRTRLLLTIPSSLKKY